MTRPSRHSWREALALLLVRAAAVVVPRRDRDAWRQEWEAEIVHRADWSDDMSLVRRSAGSIFDAAWLRRQFTRDSDLVHDVTHAWRLYRRSPAGVGLVMVLLGIGIGAATAVFSAVDAILLKPLPFPDAARTARIFQHSNTGERTDASPGNFFDWQARATRMDFAAAEPYSRDYTGGAEPEILSGARVTEGFFDAFGVRPQYGRLPSRDDYRLRRSVVVLSDAVWTRRFGAAPDIVGRSIRLDDEPFEVIGILPATFEPRVLGGRLDVWTLKATVEDYERRMRSASHWYVVARLRPGVTLAEGQAELDRISAQLGVEHPQTNRTVRAAAVPLRTHLAGGTERPLALLALGAALILVLAVGSVANLQLTLLTARLHEFAVRSALGAARGRIVRQVIAESAAIAVVAVGIGLTLASIALGLLRGAALDLPPLAAGATLNLTTILFAVGLGLAAAVLSSALPVLTVLRSGTAGRVPGALSVRGQVPKLYGRSALVVVQISLALVLLVSAGLLARSFIKLLGVDAGLMPRHLLALQVFAYDRNDTAAKRTQFFADTIARMRALPGVESVGAASTVPFLKADLDISSALVIQGKPATPDAVPRVFLTSATPGYFRTAGIPLRRGRDFEPTDTLQSRMVAIVNEVAARRFWPGADPIGSTIEVVDYGRKKTLEIVGVSGDIRYGGLEGSPRPEVFIPHAQSPAAGMTYVVRTAGDVVSINSLKQAVWAVDPLQTFYDAGAVPDMISASLRPRVFILQLALFFAGIGFVLAIAGAYGAVAWAVRRRTAEFGVRMALGATGSDIRRHMLAYGSRLAAIGLAIGLVCALALGRLLGTFLYEVQPGDPLTLLAITATVFLAVLAAAWLPARRASRIDPTVALGR
ncbi:MAG TPA: ABC transporter permease [Vicinamibacterales bacterium]|nr:ABC transporter permease [Vicinamibacterales bacterium]